MNLNDLTKPIDSTVVAEQIKTQFGTDYNIEKLGLKESVALLNKTDQLIVEFKQTHSLYESESNSTYMKLIMVNEAATRRATELTAAKTIQESDMENKLLAKALKIATKGGQLSEEQLTALRISDDMKAILRSQSLSESFMRKLVESKKSKIMESEINQAQTTIAAQDIADQMQSMIEKFADIKYKELPALHDSIRNAQGVDAAESFNAQLVTSLDEVTASLESAKDDVNNAVAELTGEEVATGAGDLDLDDFGGEPEMDMDIDAELDLDGELEAGDDTEFDVDLETDDEEVDLGRERR